MDFAGICWLILTHDPADEIQGVAPCQLSHVFVGIASRDEAADEVLAVGGGLQPVEIRSGDVGHELAEHLLVEGDVIADEGIRPDGHVVDTDELDHIVIVVEDAVYVLVGSSLRELGTAVMAMSPPFLAQAASSSSLRVRQVGRREWEALWL